MLDLDFGLVTLTEVDGDGFVGLQVDLPGEKRAASPAGEIGTPLGIFSRPHDPILDAEGEPDPAKACGALYAFYGDRLHVLPQQDPRMVAKLPRVEKGGTCLYGGKLEQPTFVHVDGKSGSIDIYVPYAWNGGAPTKAMAISVDVRSSGAESVSIVHGDGMALTMMAGGKKSVVLKNAAGDAYVEVNDEGGVLNGNWKVTGSLDVGGPGTVPMMTAGFTPALFLKGK